MTKPLLENTIENSEVRSSHYQSMSVDSLTKVLHRAVQNRNAIQEELNYENNLIKEIETVLKSKMQGFNSCP